MPEEAIHNIRKTYGPYLCTRLLGVSSNNTVYYATHTGTGKAAALRAITVNIDGRAQAIAECRAELEKFAALTTPNIVPIDDFGNDESTVYLAMPLMKGGSLSDRLKYRRHKAEDGINIPLPSPGEVVEMLERVGEALDGLHSEDIVHGQVEPRNIMFDENGEAYLADIGLTRLLKIIYSLDATNSFNTNKYTAPELWDGQRPLPATDQYSLACIAYELITGRPPFDAPTIFGLMKQHTDDVVLPPHYVRDGIPSDLALPFWQAMAKPPERRYADINAFVVDVRQAVAEKEGSPTGFFTFEMTQPGAE